MRMKVTAAQLNTPLADLEGYGLTMRTLSQLEIAGYHTVGDMIGVTPRQLHRASSALAAVGASEVGTALLRFLRGERPDEEFEQFKLSVKERARAIRAGEVVIHPRKDTRTNRTRQSRRNGAGQQGAHECHR